MEKHESMLKLGYINYHSERVLSDFENQPVVRIEFVQSVAKFRFVWKISI